MFLKMLSFGSKECTEELKLECASFLGQLDGKLYKKNLVYKISPGGAKTLSGS